ncbi:MAG: fluoride efflux transporter CrcB [Bacteroidota bacterium]
MEWLAVFLGGGVGSLFRYAISRWVPANGPGFPTATFVANVLACVVLGLAWGYVSRHVSLSPSVKLFVLVGFCGGFSTFSTFSLETLRLFQEGKSMMAVVYILSSILVCILVLFLTQKAM